MRIRSLALTVAVSVASMAAPAAASADPWERGVPPASQDKATVLFDQGNALFSKEAYGPALDKYSEAIAVWDHPAIRLNRAIAEIQLDRLIDAADDLDAALKYGEAPFSQEQYRSAVNYEKLVSRQIGFVEARCDQADVDVTLDGKPWFKGKDKQRRRVLAGAHVVVAQRPGYMSVTRSLVVTGQATATAEVSLLPLSAFERYEYPTARWIPIAIGAAGTIVALGGFATWSVGRSQMVKFDSRVEVLCDSGCSPNLDANFMEQQLAEQRDRARLEGRVGDVMMVAGGAVALTGIIWMIVNRPHRFRPVVEAAPTATGAAAAASWTF